MDDELLRALARTQKRHAGPDASMDTTADRVAQTEPLPADLVRPFDTGERSGMLDAVFARVDAEAASAETTQLARARKAQRIRVVALVGVVTAIAAALILWIATPRGQHVTLPSYQVTELHGGASAVRSDPQALDRRLELRMGESIDITLTPASATSVPLAVHLVAQSEARPPVMARVPARVSPSGAVRIAGALDAWLPLEPGEWRITVSVGPEADAPATVEDALKEDGRRLAEFSVNLVKGR